MERQSRNNLPAIMGLRNELLLINVLALALVAAIWLWPSSILRVILGLPFVLFLPGYALVAALLPRKNDLDGIERVALSFGLSIAVVPLIWLLLNYAWAVRLEPVLCSIVSFIFVTSVVAWIRRRRLSEHERFALAFQFRLPGWMSTISFSEKALSAILVLSILATLSMLGYALANPRLGERYTEFYILGLDGKAAGYPKALTVGEEGEVIVGVVNHEREVATYHVDITIDGVENNSVGPVTLEHDGKWEEVVGFVPETVGNDQRVEFLLHKEGQEDAYRRLQLWVDVTD